MKNLWLSREQAVFIERLGRQIPKATQDSAEWSMSLAASAPTPLCVPCRFCPWPAWQHLHNVEDWVPVHNLTYALAPSCGRLIYSYCGVSQIGTPLLVISEWEFRQIDSFTSSSIHSCIHSVNTGKIPTTWQSLFKAEYVAVSKNKSPVLRRLHSSGENKEPEK